MMTTDMTRLDGQVAIVTGGAQGIGQGIALVLAKAGAEIVIGDIQEAGSTLEAIRSLGGRAVSKVMDISIPGDATALVDLAVQEYGRLDVLVNNAARFNRPGTWDLPDEEWERTIAVNLSGVFYCSRAAVGPMMKAGSGSIVNISSKSAHSGRKGYSPAYTTSKAGIIGLTMNFASQVSDLGIRVNAILPGPVDHPDALLRRSAIEGAGTPQDIGEAVRYLVSPAARWVSGTALEISGAGF